MRSAIIPSGTYGAFLTHDWGSGHTNHERVKLANEALKLRGIVTWFDGDRMAGNLLDTMADGIEKSDMVVVFLTAAYMEKVGGSKAADNCRIEFSHAQRLGRRMVPVDRKWTRGYKW